ncbi:hypothetical protein EX30DRAFT_182437 [Ascodesmis nigricans]|uniref:Uncharacterized protein n=1 Tax=Ascodesmis nigricans TaxID=341454 RepID=A0A4S2N083_9PEZI|nr:hypothetical protein EX30DRAFT_182437 [Ascodesmis nigricans]
MTAGMGRRRWRRDEGSDKMGRGDQTHRDKTALPLAVLIFFSLCRSVVSATAALVGRLRKHPRSLIYQRFSESLPLTELTNENAVYRLRYYVKIQKLAMINLTD